MFRYVFGGAIHVSGNVPYVDYLMPGVFAQTVAFGAIQTGVGLAEDLHKGLIERFRSLPMARSAVLAGRTLADLDPQRVRHVSDDRGRLPGGLPGADQHARAPRPAWP